MKCGGMKNAAACADRRTDGYREGIIMSYGNRGGSRGAPAYDNNMKGALFENDRQEKEGDPHMRGQVEIDGIEYWVAGWWNKSKAKVEYLSLKFTAKEERSNQRNDTRQPYGPGNRAGNARGPGARVNPGRRGPNSDQRDDPEPRGGYDEMDDDIPF